MNIHDLRGTGSFTLPSYSLDPRSGGGGTQIPLIAWSTGGNIITWRQYVASAGTQNATLMAGGMNAAGNAAVATTEEYNGATWATGGAMITARIGPIGTGTQNAGLIAGGINILFDSRCTNTEEYNGTSWANGGTLTRSTYEGGGAGTQNEGLVFGGNGATAIYTEEYNGTTWSTGGDLINGHFCFAGLGTQNAALATSGLNSSNILTTCTDEYNGTSWSAGGALNLKREGFSAGGLQNDAFVAGGEEFISAFNTYANTETYDGTTWINNASLITPRAAGGGTGDVTNPIMFAGSNQSSPFSITSTEEGISTLTVAGWSSGGALITARELLSGAGTQNEALAIGGTAGASCVGCTEEYNGSTWATGGVLILARSFAGGGGTQNAALSVGGFGGIGDPVTTCTEEYNGTSWSAGGALLIANASIGFAGIQNEALIFAGTTQEYNGTTWTSGGAMITSRSGIAGAGTQNAALGAGGCTAPAVCTNTEEYNGTSWSAGTVLSIPKSDGGTAGIQNNASVFGGRTIDSNGGGNFNIRNQYFYNGTSWSTGIPTISSGGRNSGAGEKISSLAFGGSTPTVLSSTDEYSEGSGGTIFIPSGSIGSLWLDTSVRCLKFIRSGSGGFTTGSINAV